MALSTPHKGNASISKLDGRHPPGQATENNVRYTEQRPKLEMTRKERVPRNNKRENDGNLLKDEQNANFTMSISNGSARDLVSEDALHDRRVIKCR